MGISTQDKIKIAARKIFIEKGYSGARTRDIAEEAGINLALVNYYYRSKDTLFKIIMEEKIDELFGTIIPILAKKDTSLIEKIDEVVDKYFDLLLKVPELPLFVINELRQENINSKIVNRLKVIFENKDIVKYLNELNPNLSNYHIMMNFIGIIIFPFISKPIFVSSSIIDQNEFSALIKTQKGIVSQLVKSLALINPQIK